MIIIVTDEIEPWFTYIWDQFARINSLSAQSRITTYSDYPVTSSNQKEPLIEYGMEQKLTRGLFIPKRKTFKSDDYVWIDDDLPVYRDTIDGDKKNIYDIFYNAFIHLSRLEEWESEKRGRYIRSYSFNHPRKDRKIWKIPIVNFLFNELEKWIKAKYPEVSFGNRAMPMIEFSHDVDYVNKTIQLRIKQPFFNVLKCCKQLLQFNFAKGVSNFRNGVNFAYRGCDYWCFDCWSKLEKELNIKSVYYFFGRSYHRKLSLRRWLIDPSYDINENGTLKEKCKELISDGNEIGIHGSYFSAGDESLFKKEKEILENSIRREITKSRQHWLNYYEGRTPYIHTAARIEEDSSLGFIDVPGFRAGIGSIYNPYDHRNNMPFPFKEIPLVMVDSQLYDYSDDYDLDHLRWLFDSIRKIKNVAMSVAWHQRAISNDYGWDEGYRKLVSMIKNEDG
jgi:hypothetical protein